MTEFQITKMQKHSCVTKKCTYKNMPQATDHLYDTDITQPTYIGAVTSHYCLVISIPKQSVTLVADHVGTFN